MSIIKFFVVNYSTNLDVPSNCKNEKYHPVLVWPNLLNQVMQHTQLVEDFSEPLYSFAIMLIMDSKLSVSLTTSRVIQNTVVSRETCIK